DVAQGGAGDEVAEVEGVRSAVGVLDPHEGGGGALVVDLAGGEVQQRLAVLPHRHGLVQVQGEDLPAGAGGGAAHAARDVEAAGAQDRRIDHVLAVGG